MQYCTRYRENVDRRSVLTLFLRCAVCRTGRIKKLFGQYAGYRPEDVLETPDLYEDIVLHAPTLELTAMVVLTRDLDVMQLRKYAAVGLLCLVLLPSTIEHVLERSITVMTPAGKSSCTNNHPSGWVLAYHAYHRGWQNRPQVLARVRVVFTFLLR